MVFNSPTVVVTFFIVGCIWISIITFVLYRISRHYNRLIKGTTKIGLTDILNNLLDNRNGFKKRIDSIESAVDKVQTAGKFHIQRVGIVRFNPFSDTGGAQSFTMALLDGNDNGVVMTSLYVRNGNRWYVKEVRAGKGKGMVLSEEEEVAIKKAAPIDTHHE